MSTLTKTRPGCGIALGLTLLLLTGGGCVEQRFIVTTDPEGAIVSDYQNRPQSGSPADMPFTWYGKYTFTINKEGYETLVAEENVKAPWYLWPGLDFVTENLLPWTVRDVRKFHYNLKPLQIIPTDEILGPAQALRTRAEGIGQPRQTQSSPADLAPPPLPEPQPIMPPR